MRTRLHSSRLGSMDWRLSRSACPVFCLAFVCFAVSIACAWEAPSIADATKAAQSGSDVTKSLDNLVAPIALYPDSLLAQILPASTNPLQIVEAARYLRKSGGKVDQLPDNDWDPSIRTLIKFPQILYMMDEKLSWTQQLGDAVIGQQAEVMDAIQQLRKQAQAAGYLKSNEQQVVVVEKEVIKVVPADPQIVYVPSYDPKVVYVVNPSPQVVYVEKDEPDVSPLVTFGIGMAVGAILADDDCDWHHHHVYHVGYHYGHADVNVNRNVNRNVNLRRDAAGRGYAGRQPWQPSKKARGRYDAQRTGRAQQARAGVKPALSRTQAGANRDRARGRSLGAASRDSRSRAQSTNRGGRSSARSTGRSRGGAFDGYNRGATTRKNSQRGQRSRQSSASSRRSSGRNRGGGASGSGRGSGRSGGGGRGRR